jgi:hypothetical protein
MVRRSAGLDSSWAEEGRTVRDNVRERASARDERRRGRDMACFPPLRDIKYGKMKVIGSVEGISKEMPGYMAQTGNISLHSEYIIA